MQTFITATATDDSILAPGHTKSSSSHRFGWQVAGNDHTEEVRTYRMKPVNS